MDKSSEVELSIRMKSIELAIEVAKISSTKGLTKKSYDGKYDLDPSDSRFLFGTAKEIAEYIRGNFSMNYFLPPNYDAEPDTKKNI